MAKKRNSTKEMIEPDQPGNAQETLRASSGLLKPNSNGTQQKLSDLSDTSDIADDVDAASHRSLGGATATDYNVTRERLRKWSSVGDALRCIALLVLVCGACVVSQLTLSPIYGSIPSSTWHGSIQFQAPILAALLYYFGVAADPSAFEGYLPLHAWAVPAILHYALAPYSDTLGPSYGPLLTELVLLLPILFLAHYVLLARLTSDIADNSRIRHFVPVLAALLGPLTIAGSKLFAFLYNDLASRNMDDPWLSRWALQCLLGVHLSLLYPSRRLLVVLPLVIFQAFINPHAPFEPAMNRLSASLERTEGFKVLERLESNTGYLSVLESTRDAYRVLRCDHSLLGGNWLPTPERRTEGITTVEPIYPVFTMLEAVNLMYDPMAAPRVPTAPPKTALVIGLGIGTAPKALSEHGVQTTVLELDPGVTRLARDYFDLPRNVSVKTQDALRYVRIQRENELRDIYDYIIHDVFTGGAEPLPLFEYEFLVSLRHILDLGGYIAVNYAGDLKNPHTADVIATIYAAFSYNCRLFRENEAPLDTEAGPDFTNLVVFCACTKTEGSPTPSWKFRSAQDSDFLGSVSRRHSLPPRHEVNLQGLSQRRKTRAEQKLVVDQTMSAEQHWRIMRKVLPAKVWELY